MIFFCPLKRRYSQKILKKSQDRSMSLWKKDEPKGSHCSKTTLAAIESLVVPLVQEVVFLADFRCPRCQQRVAEIMSKMNGETQSVVISVVEKKVTLTCTNPKIDKLSGRQLAHWSSWSKVSLIVRLFRSSCT